MKKIVACFLCFLCFATPSMAKDFTSYITHVKNYARQQGISSRTLEQAFVGIEKPNARILELDKKQPEGTITFPQYRKNIVNAVRIKKGRALYRQHYSLLNEISKKYGVQPQYIVALWGIETNFGGFTGGMDIVESLATLGYDGRRSEFFTNELYNALKILDDGHVKYRSHFKGSWAGAMGQCQFMPSSFLSMAVDYDGDGRKDIWDSQADVFASIANYLSTKGWRGDARWGREVILPKGFDVNLQGRDKMAPLLFWQKLGVKTLSGNPIPVANFMGAIVIPEGSTKTAFLVYDNYNVLMDWNRSLYFATSVGLLADAIAQ